MTWTHHYVRTALTVTCVLIAGPAGAQDAPGNLTGTWLFNVTTDAGTGTPTVVLKQQGDTLTGTYSSQVFGEQQIRGTVKDREFRFEFTASIQGTTLTVTYQGTIASADSLSGQVNLGGMGSGSFTAKRQRAGPAKAELPAAVTAMHSPHRGSRSGSHALDQHVGRTSPLDQNGGGDATRDINL